MKNKIIWSLILIFLFSGCNQKLSEEQLEEKAKEHFYSLEDGELFGVPYKVEDFVLAKTETMQSNEYKLYDYLCKGPLSGKCYLSEGELYSLNEKIYVYHFEQKEEVKRNDRTYKGTVILKSNGELIAAFVDGIEHFVL